MTATFFPLEKVLLKNSTKKFYFSKSEINVIESIWKRESKNRALFNGTILCIQEIKKNVLITFKCPYKYFVASQVNPLLARKLLLKPIGISALTIYDKQLIVAKRSSLVSTYRKYIETLPSGSLIPSKSVENQLLCELYEEAGIEKSLVLSTTFLGLFYSPRSGIYDLGYQITLSKKTALIKSKEHSSVEWISFSSWESLLNSKQVTPVSRLLWKVYSDSKVTATSAS